MRRLLSLMLWKQSILFSLWWKKLLPKRLLHLRSLKKRQNSQLPQWWPKLLSLRVKRLSLRTKSPSWEPSSWLMLGVKAVESKRQLYRLGAWNQFLKTYKPTFKTNQQYHTLRVVLKLFLLLSIRRNCQYLLKRTSVKNSTIRRARNLTLFCREEIGLALRV